MKNTTKTTTSTNVNHGIVGQVVDNADGTRSLILSVPLQHPALTENKKNYVIAKTGTWPKQWVTVDVDGEKVGLTLCALIPNPEHPDNKPAPVVPVAPPVPQFFQNKSNATPKVNGNGVSKRIMPGSMA
ncbi:MAG TPA: hypothetical protein VNU68_34785 [Verrucomicrobiae bacterium]|nr:hypothetical protein [Verrucomicrobiae bacterium]